GGGHRGHAVGGNHLLAGERDPGLGRARSPGPAGRIHPRRGPHRQHRARHQLAPSPGRCTAMTTAMTTGYGWPLIITGVVLAVVGGAMVWASGPRRGR